MKQLPTFPPNYHIIEQYLTHVPGAVYCYGDTIYNPDNRELTPDVEHHESIHMRQQGAFPGEWWQRYLTDLRFRLEQEIEAYGEQYAYACRLINKAAADAPEGQKLAGGRTKMLDYALESMASALSGAAYGNMLSYGRAVSKIRNHAKYVQQS